MISPINKVIKWQLIHGQPNARIYPLVYNKTRKEQPKKRPENKTAPAPRGLCFSMFFRGSYKGEGGGGASQIPTGFTTGEEFAWTVFIVKMITGVFNRNS